MLRLWLFATRTLLCLCSILFLGSPTYAWILSNEALVKKCYPLAQKRINQTAQRLGCDVSKSSLIVLDIKTHWKMSSKYVWYQSGETCDGRGYIVKLIRHTYGQCF